MFGRHHVSPNRASWNVLHLPRRAGARSRRDRKGRIASFQNRRVHTYHCLALAEIVKAAWRLYRSRFDNYRALFYRAIVRKPLEQRSLIALRLYLLRDRLFRGVYRLVPGPRSSLFPYPLERFRAQALPEGFHIDLQEML